MSSSLGGGWFLSLYPAAAEGGGCFVSSYRPPREFVARGRGRDPGRSVAEAGRRARAALRRYCAANVLNRMGTLTYGPPRCTDPHVLREHIGVFFRDLRVELGGERFPYVWVPELHADGVHFHVHFAVGRYVHWSVIRRVWGRGRVDMRMFNRLPVGSGPLTEARTAAGYLSKYVAKTFVDPGTRVLGMHRYDLAQGFQPEKTSLRGRSSGDVLDQASGLLGLAPSALWSSEQALRWDGPPAIWAQWGR